MVSLESADGDGIVERFAKGIPKRQTREEKDV